MATFSRPDISTPGALPSGLRWHFHPMEFFCGQMSLAGLATTLRKASPRITTVTFWWEGLGFGPQAIATSPPLNIQPPARHYGPIILMQLGRILWREWQWQLT